MMSKALEKESLEVETKSYKDDPKFFKKHQVRTCPILLELDNGKVVGRITGVEDIIKKLKENA
jgi:hypothetical protein